MQSLRSVNQVRWQARRSFCPSPNFGGATKQLYCSTSKLNLTPEIQIYVHWPYCRHICPYCDFNRVLLTSELDIKRLSSAYETEIRTLMRLAAAEKGGIPRVQSIYFGGGTPSTAPPELIETIINTIASEARLENTVEITLEANPTSADVLKLRDYRKAGVNRLSLGVQSLRDHDLKYLGRKHSSVEAINALVAAQSIFDRHSFDLIYARRRDHSIEDWKQELKEALKLSGGHLSLYSLTIESGTAYEDHYSYYQFLMLSFAHQLAKGRLHPCTEEQHEEFYHTTVEILNSHGYRHYETSNFALPDHESVHNMGYWKGRDYIGIGPGAAGRILTSYGLELANQTLIQPQRIPQREVKTPVRVATMNIKSPTKWMDAVERQKHGLLEVVNLTTLQQVTELLLGALRTDEGVSNTQFKLFSGGQPFEVALNRESIRRNIESGLLVNRRENSNEPLVATPSGRSILDTLLVSLLPD